ncbi:MAG: hypothetical protein H7A45_14745 [Verrucomicrobiales bacterium]|nr:hypothetical protein [Verrucomicrobiales bacterium]MCP5528390.1 hypothetical protein [Verrucomicrobiales bacterium]
MSLPESSEPPAPAAAEARAARRAQRLLRWVVLLLVFVNLAILAAMLLFTPAPADSSEDPAARPARSSEAPFVEQPVSEP